MKVAKLKETLIDLLKLIGVVLLIPFAILFRILMIVFIFLLFFFYWMTGHRWNIKVKGETVGYVRWFSYTPVKK